MSGVDPAASADSVAASPPAAPSAPSPLESLLAGLRRAPDVDDTTLVAVDAADRHLLDAVAERVREAPRARIAVLGDTHGALTLGLLALGAAQVHVWQDSIVGREALQGNAGRAALEGFAVHDEAADAVRGASLVLARLPRALDALDELSRIVAREAAPDVVLVAGGMIKHMSLGMNDVLKASFGRIDVSLARQKSRLLTAREPRPGVSLREPERAHEAELGLEIVAAPGAFAGASLDIGTRALLAQRHRMPAWSTAIDLASGTGVVAALLARENPAGRVIATDVSAAAVRSTRLTAEANSVDVEARWADGLDGVPEGTADLILLNPPFHVGAAVHTGMARRLFTEAARVLRPGGELWCVFNSHLKYTPELERVIGSTRQVARDAKFTVTASRRR
ncbi:methyltransferase [Microcella daejeonensis]|uniref:Methyltransferase n=1 Tax=Microcella daejeonensis TaxID=2994971 RepID=A0A9E8MM96_9MICO|nr:class I SAM-dependent methyltransferase [Microcella daejeonensis]WAB82254.1 methyltransferase [Microcella daejeonensis]